MSEASKSVPLPLFDGTHGKFELYWPKFEAYANLKGFREAIDTTHDGDLPADPKTLSSDADTKKKEEKAIMKNKLALANFTMSFQTVALMDRVNESKTSEYPSGLAHKIVEGLMKTYRPKDQISKLEALAELDKVEMK